jgi:transcription termination factor Rho
MAKSSSKPKKKRKHAKKRSSRRAAAERANPQEQDPGVATATAEPDTEKQADGQELTDEESTHAKYERIKKGELYLTDLQKLTVAELHEVAKNEGVSEYSALKKQDMIFKILKERIHKRYSKSAYIKTD